MSHRVLETVGGADKNRALYRERRKNPRYCGECGARLNYKNDSGLCSLHGAYDAEPVEAEKQDGGRWAGYLWLEGLGRVMDRGGYMYRELAAPMGVVHGTIVGWATLRHRVSPEDAGRLADLLGTSVEELTRP